MTACGFTATCGRNFGHGGHHGGWRSGIAVVSPEPYEHAERSVYAVGSELTPMNLAVLVEYAHHGHQAAVAACLGMSLQTVKNHMSAIHARTGTSSFEVYTLLGWLKVPPGLGNKHAGDITRQLKRDRAAALRDEAQRLEDEVES